MKASRIYYSIILFLSSFLFVPSLFSQDLIYKAVNPAFGGETFNYNWLMSSAQAQDLTKDPNATTTGFNSRNTLDDFTASLNRQLLSQLSRQLLGNQFGEDGITEGSYTIGDFQIDVVPDLEGLSITIVDNATGGQTQIIVPYY